jgi:MFS family permease
VSRQAVRLLATAEAISATGSLAAYTALTYEVYHLTGSAYWVSTAAFASFALAGAAAPFAGWLADRYDRRRVMIGSDLSAALIYAAAAIGATEPFLLVLVTALGTLAAAPFRPAGNAALPNLVEAEDLARANGLLSSAHSIGIVAGPVAGGLLVAASGATGAFIINAASFVLSALLVGRVRGNFAAPGRSTHESVERGAGFRVAAGDPLLRCLLATEFLLLLGIGIGIAGDAPLARELGAGPAGYAAIITSWGLGSVLAGLALSRWPERPPRVDLGGLGVGLVMIAVAMAGTALLPTLPPVVAVQFVGGAGMSLVFVLRNVIVQRTTEDAVRGRVFAALDTAVAAGSLGGLALAGLVIEQSGARAAYAWAAVLATLAGLIAIGVMRGSRPASRSAQAS